MNNMQKQYAAFMESVCARYKCESALPSLREGFKAFCEAVDDEVPMTMEVEKKMDNVPDDSGNMTPQEVAYVTVNNDIAVRITQSYCEILESGHIVKTVPFDYGESSRYPGTDSDAGTGMVIEHKREEAADFDGMRIQEVVEVQLNSLFTVRVTKKCCEILEHGHIIETVPLN